jgi:ubiquinone/menaquinone biosynthesis C-methylase UbiE
VGFDGETIDESADLTQADARDAAEKIRSSYDTVAERYASELADDMIARPIERGLFLAFAELVNKLGDGVVGEVGCGPAHIAKHLASLGLRTVGVDISPAMIDQARRRFPRGELFVASMFDLPVPDGAWLGAASIYATLHCNAVDRMRSFHEIRRVLRAGGYFLHSFYVSAPDQPEGSIYHLQKWFGYSVDLPTYFVGIEQAAREMDGAGFEVMAALVREPLQVNELPTRRCYMLGKRR